MVNRYKVKFCAENQMKIRVQLKILILITNISKKYNHEAMSGSYYCI